MVRWEAGRVCSVADDLAVVQYCGSPSLLMTPGSSPCQHTLAQQIELGSTVTDALDDLESVHLAF